MGQLFEKADFSYSDGDIENLLDPLDGWRMPSSTEWASILGTTRAGSTVNGSIGKHYAKVKVHGSSHTPYCEAEGLNCLLIFPDNRTIVGKALSYMDNTTITEDMTALEVDEYLSQGCALLPGDGYCSWDEWDGGWYTEGNYLSSTEYNSAQVDLWFFSDGSCNNSRNYKSDYYFSVRLVK